MEFLVEFGENSLINLKKLANEALHCLPIVSLFPAFGCDIVCDT